jgi:hypothetical protein
MPSTTIITPEHAASISRTALGITSTRDSGAPSGAYCAPWCSAGEDD